MGIFSSGPPKYFICPECDESVDSNKRVCDSCGKEFNTDFRDALIQKQIEAEAKLVPIFIAAGLVGLCVATLLFFLPVIAPSSAEEFGNLRYIAAVFVVGGLVTIGLGVKGYLKKA